MNQKQKRKQRQRAEKYRREYAFRSSAYWNAGEPRVIPDEPSYREGQALMTNWVTPAWDAERLQSVPIKGRRKRLSAIWTCPVDLTEMRHYHGLFAPATYPV